MKQNKRFLYYFVYLILSILWVFMCSGIIWGWASLVVVLEKEHIYYNECQNAQNIVDIPSDDISNDLVTCPEQITRLNLIFTIGVVTSNMISLIAGLALDRYGARKLTFVGSILFGLGALLFGLSAEYKFDGFIPGFMLLGMGGPAIFFSMMSTSNFFPGYVSTVISFLNCAFDASVFVFFIFKAIYENTSASIGTIFMIYSAFSIPMIISAFKWPTLAEYKQFVSEPTELENLPKEDLLAKEDGEEEAGSAEEEENSKKVLDLSKKSIKQQILSKEYLFLLAYICLNQLWLNTYIGTIEQQLKRVYEEEKAIELTQIFSLILPVGLLFSPLVGWLLDRRGIITSLTVLGISFEVWALLNFFQEVEALLIINFIIFAFCRALFYAAVSTFTIKVFGFQSFGRLFGIAQLLAGFVGLLQYVLLTLTFSVFDGNFLAMNLLQICTVTLLASFPVWLKYRSLSK